MAERSSNVSDPATLTSLLTPAAGRALELVHAHAPPGEGSPTQVATQYRTYHTRQESETLRALETATSPTAVDGRAGFTSTASGLPPKNGNVLSSSFSRLRLSPKAAEGERKVVTWAVDEEREGERERNSDEYLRSTVHAYQQQQQQPNDYVDGQGYSMAMPPSTKAPVQKTLSQSNIQQSNTQQSNFQQLLASKTNVYVRLGFSLVYVAVTTFASGLC